MPSRNEDTKIIGYGVEALTSTTHGTTTIPFDIELEGKNRAFDALTIGTVDIEKVIFNPPATIVYFKDGSKTVVKCSKDDEYNEYAGMAICIAKKVLGSKFHNVFNKWVGRSKDGE